MDGRAVFRFAVDALPRCLHAVLDETQLALGDVDWVVCHQANSRIIDHCVKALHADAAKFYKNMDRHGNTSAASIPVALNEMAEAGLLKAGQKVSCIGFGGGLTWGGMLVTYSLSHADAMPALPKGERSKVKPINRTIYMKLLNEILGTKYPIIQAEWPTSPPASLPLPAPTPVRWVLSAQAA